MKKKKKKYRQLYAYRNDALGKYLLLASRVECTITTEDKKQQYWNLLKV